MPDERHEYEMFILNAMDEFSEGTVPLSHPFIERLIGTIRREFLDHLMFWNAQDLERKLEEFQHYYNHHRVHASLGGQIPAEDRGPLIVKEAALDDFTWEKHCHGLVQLPRAA
jgi:hypothetical protein